MSAHATPVLSGAIPTFELFITQWEQLGEQFGNLKPWTDIGLKWANKYYNRMDDTRAYIIAMCKFFFSLTPSLVNLWTSYQSMHTIFMDRQGMGCHIHCPCQEGHFGCCT